MLRKLIVAVAVVLMLGGTMLIPTDASARGGRGGRHGGHGCRLPERPLHLGCSPLRQLLALDAEPLGLKVRVC